jgi:hypothetical protein
MVMYPSEMNFHLKSPSLPILKSKNNWEAFGVEKTEITQEEVVIKFEKAFREEKQIESESSDRS